VSLSDRLAKLNLAQRSTRFKIGASIAVVIAAVVAFTVWWTITHAPDSAAAQAPGQTSAQSAPQTATPDDQRAEHPAAPRPDAEEESEAGAAVASEQELQSLRPRLDPGDVLSAIGSRDATLGVAFGVAAAAAVALLVIWLGAGLTYLAIAALTVALVGPLKLIPATSELGSMIAGVAALAASFTVFIETARVLLAPSNPVFAVARTVVAEAVRMKISLVFILLLLGWLASLPWLLDEAQPLRYRVQTFLRNGAAGAFWSLALLTMFFSVATVAFEQRDKTIWATIVKPVAAWQYILGKWLGVMAINAALLAVSATGIFLFTEYLRAQPANGEIAAYVNEDGTTSPTTDRLILEARVLTARVAAGPDLPPISQEEVMQRARERALAGIPAGSDNEEAIRATARNFIPNVTERLEAARTAISPFDDKTYVFTGLKRAKELGKPVTFRYTVQSGANDPTEIVAMLFVLTDHPSGEAIPVPIDAPLDIAQSIDLKPNVISDDGVLRVQIYNGDPTRNLANPLTIRFPPGGLEALYVAGGYEANFLRITTALWVKLGFIAAAGVFAATFLSFPVAALFTFLVLFAAETSGFLRGSLEIYTSVDQEGNTQPFRLVIRAIAIPITKIFAGYRGLDSTDKLVDGRLLSWSDFVVSAAVIGALIIALLGAAVGVFRNRELAIYSGH